MSKIQHPTPSLRVLSFTLRNKELWPEGFVWNFHTCDTCAMGMAKQMWPKHIKASYTEEMICVFGIPEQEAHKLFTQINELTWNMLVNGGRYTSVTPEDIADRIDAYLEKVPELEHA